MNLMRGREAKAAFTAIGIGALLYGLFRLYRFFDRPTPKTCSNDETLSD
jgi:hypothetical protein